MGRADDACVEVVAKVAGALACALVSPDGQVIGECHVHDRPGEAHELLARAVRDAARSAGLAELERLVCATRKLSLRDSDGLGELFVASECSWYFMKGLSGAPHVLVLKTTPGANIGMAWARLKTAAASLPAATLAVGAGSSS